MSETAAASAVAVVGESAATVAVPSQVSAAPPAKEQKINVKEALDAERKSGSMGYSLTITKYHPSAENRMEQTFDIRDVDRKVSESARGITADCVVFRAMGKDDIHHLCIATAYQLIEITSNSKWRQYVEACTLEFECDYTALFGGAKNARVSILYACRTCFDANYIQRKIRTKWKKDNPTGKLDLRGCFSGSHNELEATMLCGPCPWAKRYAELTGKKLASDSGSAAAQAQ